MPSDLRADIAHGSDRHWRLHRAHLNCVENLPPFAVVVLTASVVGVRNGTLDLLALTFIAARIQWACLLAFAGGVVRATG